MSANDELKGWFAGRLPKDWFTGAPEVQLTGVEAGKAGICQQGTILEKIQWSYTNEKCD